MAKWALKLNFNVTNFAIKLTTLSVISKALIISHGKTSNGVLSQSDFCLIAATTNEMSQSLAIMNTRSIIISKGEIEFSECKNPLGVISWVQYLKVIQVDVIRRSLKVQFVKKFPVHVSFRYFSYQTNLIKPEMKLNNAMIMAPVCNVRQKQHRLSGPKLRFKSSTSSDLRSSLRFVSFVFAIAVKIKNKKNFSVKINDC